MSEPLLELRCATRRYRLGGQEVSALQGIDLDIRAGEMVALMGASGSGKSTLMNVLGCLDRLDAGDYRVDGRDVSKLDSDELAALRRTHFGFVFQRYNLITQLSTLANVEVPAIYAGQEAKARQVRAQSLLERLGLGERMEHRPNQLSGGQQQRVSIARALMNGGAVILADEPTGALDRQTGREVLDLLLELNRLGHTLIVATHDPSVAAYADRTVELADGRIVADRSRDDVSGLTKVDDAEQSHLNSDPLKALTISSTPAEAIGPALSPVVSAAFWIRLTEAAQMATIALRSHPLRTILTLLGVVIGIVSVVTMIALGEAAQRVLAAELRGLSRNTLEIFPGKDWGDPDASRIQTLNLRDVEMIRQQSFVIDASPQITLSSLLRYRAINGTARINGVDPSFLQMMGLRILQGTNFDPTDVARQAQVVVIDPNVRDRFFGAENPIGARIYIGKLPCIVVGVTEHDYLQEVQFGSKFNVWLPYTTVAARLIGRSYLDDIVVALRNVDDAESDEWKITSLLIKGHQIKDFMVANLAAKARASVTTYHTMSLLLALIGVISLTVGGIGVMNIMLVSVAERAREIGVRIAVGARQSDIRRQFLIESVLLCLIGAAVGVVLSYVACNVADYFLPPTWEVWLSLNALLAAVASAVLTGVIFGYVPARNAARLDPVEALARD
jgi:macrolide transport system ATP-binding/permease protein